jgi:probable rRNA maturation factor
VSIEVENSSSYSDVDLGALVGVARHVLERMGVSPLAELSLALVDEPQMTELHLRWMDLPGPTDVMAFPMDELDLRTSRGTLAPSVGDRSEESPPLVLGDVVLCPSVAEKQAAEAGHTTGDELALLTTHGVLHLLGFDHAEPEEHAEMFGLQAELLASWQPQ